MAPSSNLVSSAIKSKIEGSSTFISEVEFFNFNKLSEIVP